MTDMKKARLNRERAIEDIQAHYKQKMHDFLVRYGADCKYIWEIVAASEPKLIKVAHGMVLFA